MHRRLQLAGDHTDLSDTIWATVAPLISAESHGPGRPARDHRVVLNGILWVLETGAAWRHAPATYGPWQTLYGRYVRWQADGTWRRVTDALRRHQAIGQQAQQAIGRAGQRAVAALLVAFLAVFLPQPVRVHRLVTARTPRIASPATRKR